MKLYIACKQLSEPYVRGIPIQVKAAPCWGPYTFAWALRPQVLAFKNAYETYETSWKYHKGGQSA